MSSNYEADKVRGECFALAETARWRARGFTVLKATSAEDRIEHWDIRVHRKGCPRAHWKRLEIKAVKSCGFDLTLLEHQGISMKAGWLYGKSDFVGFEQATSTLYVPRIALAEYAISRINWDGHFERSLPGDFPTLVPLLRGDSVIAYFPTTDLKLLVGNFSLDKVGPRP